jgi:DNA repair exonuclease SbcCD ATPase subunit
MQTVDEYKSFLTEVKTKKDLYLNQQFDIESAIEELKQTVLYLEEAKEAVNLTAILAQTQFQDVIEKLVTESLQYVFGDSYSFQLKNIINRNQPEINMYVVIDDIPYSLKDELGGGVLDIVSLSLRIVCWALNVQNTQPLLVFDEPLKFVSKDHMEALGEMLRSLSDLLGLQLILVSHESGLIDAADQAYVVCLEDGVSIVKESAVGRYL